MIDVDLAPEVLASLRAMKDRGTPPPRCHKRPIRNAIANALRWLVNGELHGKVRPWDLPGLQRGAAELGEVSAVRAVSVDDDVLVAKVVPGGQRIVFRGVDDEWRLVRFAAGDDLTLRPETTRRVELHGSAPESVLVALGVVKPDGVELEVVSTDLGRARPRQFTATSGPTAAGPSWPKRSRPRFTTAPHHIGPMFEE